MTQQFSKKDWAEVEKNLHRFMVDPTSDTITHTSTDKDLTDFIVHITTRLGGISDKIMQEIIKKSYNPETK